jgi:hypothetical protein
MLQEIFILLMGFIVHEYCALSLLRDLQNATSSGRIPDDSYHFHWNNYHRTSVFSTILGFFYLMDATITVDHFMGLLRYFYYIGEVVEIWTPNFFFK